MFAGLFWQYIHGCHCQVEPCSKETVEELLRNLPDFIAIRFIIRYPSCLRLLFLWVLFLYVFFVLVLGFCHNFASLKVQNMYYGCALLVVYTINPPNVVYMISPVNAISQLPFYIGNIIYLLNSALFVRMLIILVE